MRPIAIFYHTLFVLGDPPAVRTNALSIVHEQMDHLRKSGLVDAASEIHVGVNGGEESEMFAVTLLPEKARIKYHGLQSRAENLTLVMLEEWLKQPGHDSWSVLYFHAKGASHDVGAAYGQGVSDPWRRTMMHYCVGHWRKCVAALEAGYEAAGCHFLRGQADGTQNYFPGTFFWAQSDFLKKVPSIFLRERIKVSGIDALESRYEAEVWIGNGRLPKVYDLLPNGGGGVP